MLNNTIGMNLVKLEQNNAVVLAQASFADDLRADSANRVGRWKQVKQEYL
jgi:hypothetical protein